MAERIYITCRWNDSRGNLHERRVDVAVCEARARGVYPTPYEAAFERCMACTGYVMNDVASIARTLSEAEQDDWPNLLSAYAYNDLMRMAAAMGTKLTVGESPTKEDLLALLYVALMDDPSALITIIINADKEENNTMTKKSKNANTGAPTFTVTAAITGTKVADIKALGEGWDGTKDTAVFTASVGALSDMAEALAEARPKSIKEVIITPAPTYAAVLLPRCARELDRLGVAVAVGEEAVNIEMEGMNYVNDGGYAMDLVLRLVQRSNRKVADSDHSLTWYDVKQAAKLVWGAQNGDERAMAIVAWGDAIMKSVRDAEDAELLKVAKAAKAKAKTEDATPDPTKPKKGKGGKAKPVPKPSNAASRGSAASLIPQE